MPRPIDRTSVAGKEFPATDHLQLVVLGAGPAGVAAAVEAARLGLRVMLVDEHPVASALMGIDVPWMFGERMTASVQNQPRMLERIVAARPELEQAFEVGVDVRLGVYVWAAFVTGPTSRALPCRMLALADETQSWLIGFDRLVVAAGARDLAVAFPGWDRPGVMGAQGFAAAIGLYGAFAGRRVVVLGAGVTGLRCVQQAREAGIEVAAVVDVAAAAHEEFATHGVTVHSGCAVRGVEGGAEVEGISIVPVGGGAAVTIACDTIVSALDTVPNVEMFDLLGCAMAFRPEWGGHVPVTDADGRCSVDGIYAAGDCAGIGDAEPRDPALAASSGREAARAAARDAGFAAPAPARTIRTHGGDREARRRHWLQVHAGPAAALTICRCEDVTLRDLLGVRPPRYLSYDDAKFAGRDVRTLAGDGPVNQDQVKRLTRAGMGPCQGRRCREQVQTLLAMQGNQPSGSVPMPSYRAPLRPLPLSVLSAHDESAALRANWTGWFGIAPQWLPHWEKVPENPEYWGGRIFLDAAK
ncbi:FAD-dependent oxidoreductase [Limobrevibacterium gyesilva]|uniref:FAD-dependent oxidoreductase n=1 Tax=Limobrevibacterium gyesilva TaxID=2991712 RepID=A0AA41YS09_9PROT|nr:FAD-dependent oxidoreductase [Limobrevibacterium gyesilva]MCW3475523.1 FAD-dependent oxidoreductase [Limobrevibacterium gyesilva]